MKYFPHQIEGSQRIAERGGTMILSDVMGLGKTRTAIRAVTLLGHVPCVIVAPASLKLVWHDEIREVAPWASVNVLEGRKGEVEEADFIIVNREILTYRLDKVLKLNPVQLVIDEAHQCGGFGTKALAANAKLASAVKKANGGVLLVTGTPLVNNPSDIYRLFKLMDETVFTTLTAFEREYCPDVVFKKRIFGGIYSGKPRWMVAKEYKEAMKQGLVPKPEPEKLEQLQKILSAWSVRRVRSEVWERVPHFTKIWRVDVTDAEIRKADKAARKLISGSRMPANDENGEFAHIRRLVAEAKTPLVIEWIERFLDSTDEKLVVMGWHVDSCATIAKAFGKEAVLFRGTSAKKHDAVNRFQNDPTCRVFVANLKAGGVGITLTAAREMLLAEMPWTDADYKQARDRINRIGQTASSVSYTVCIAADTVEEIVWRIVERKAQQAELLVKGE